jgi:hypothetical protein
LSLKQSLAVLSQQLNAQQDQIAALQQNQNSPAVNGSYGFFSSARK